ncbi:MAG: zinc-ribbon domain-containing protein [Clostridia bacterium]|nr:zinc-ribbon domain-containing protein [Clostridia bacterium]
MYCKNCGKFLNDGVKFCPGCGTPVGSSIPATPQSNPKPAAKQPYQPSYAPQMYVEKKNGAGLAALILGILSIYFGVYYCVIPIIGLIVSIAGMVQRKNCNRWNGVAVAGFVINLLFFIGWAIVWIAVGPIILTLIGFAA